MILVAVIAMAVSADAQNVYVSQADGGQAYHKSKSCSYLKKSKKVSELSVAEAKKNGRHECKRCYAAPQKKAAPATKKDAKKATPARDEKGRFVKQDAKKEAKKATPARDEKGRFVKQK